MSKNFSFENWFKSLTLSENTHNDYQSAILDMVTNECMLVQFNVERKYKTDPELLSAFKNYFEC